MTAAVSKVGSVYFTALLQFTGVFLHLFMHGSLEVLPQIFRQAEVWTLSGPLGLIH